MIYDYEKVIRNLVIIIILLITLVTFSIYKMILL